jgi:hypothetical protein
MRGATEQIRPKAVSVAGTTIHPKWTLPTSLPSIVQLRLLGRIDLRYRACSLGGALLYPRFVEIDGTLHSIGETSLASIVWRTVLVGRQLQIGPGSHRAGENGLRRRA